MVSLYGSGSLVAFFFLLSFSFDISVARCSGFCKFFWNLSGFWTLSGFRKKFSFFPIGQLKKEIRPDQL
jgi:hypothetical protein